MLLFLFPPAIAHPLPLCQPDSLKVRRNSKSFRRRANRVTDHRVAPLLMFRKDLTLPQKLQPFLNGGIYLFTYFTYQQAHVRPIVEARRGRERERRIQPDQLSLRMYGSLSPKTHRVNTGGFKEAWAKHTFGVRLLPVKHGYERSSERERDADVCTQRTPRKITSRSPPHERVRGIPSVEIALCLCCSSVTHTEQGSAHAVRGRADNNNVTTSWL